MRRIFAFLGAVALVCCAAVSVSAKSAVLYEPVSATVLYEEDGYTAHPMASTTKLMTALIAAEYGDWEQTVSVTADMVAVEGSALGLRAGDTLTLRDTVCGMLLASGNDAAGAVALTLAPSFTEFARMMNQKAASLGMTQTHFVTPSGLDADGHAASAYDMALLGTAVLEQPILADICAQKQATVCISGRKITVTNHNRLLSLYNDAIGLKTGFTKKSGRCLVSAARRDGVTLVAVTLNDGDDWNSHMAMFERGFSMVRAVEFPESVLPRLLVSGGTTGAISLQTQTPEPLVLPKNQAAAIALEIHLPRFLLAPITAGDVVGEAVYTLNGEELCRVPITATESVSARPIADRQTRLFENIRLLLAGLLKNT